MDKFIQDIKRQYSLDDYESRIIEAFSKQRERKFSISNYIAELKSCHDITDISDSEIKKTKDNLFKKNLITLDNNREFYIFSDVIKRELDEHGKYRVLSWRSYGTTNSEARDSLSEVFDEEASVIFLFLAITGPDEKRFPKLKDRIQQGRETIFFMPHIKSIPPAQWEKYREKLSEWVKFFSDLKKDSKRDGKKGNERYEKCVRLYLISKG